MESHTPTVEFVNEINIGVDSEEFRGGFLLNLRNIDNVLNVSSAPDQFGHL